MLCYTPDNEGKIWPGYCLTCPRSIYTGRPEEAFPINQKVGGRKKEIKVSHWLILKTVN